ncbi:lipopolysaccharide biosynthesis protein [Kitasatospora sp. NPDC101176]|uniref:lipopolysaccharide biosynthesis protein n=1 Tax=Kitasatospora sp. NPDC101176 TaxID=3364099 RepID=UPI00382DC35B
MSNGSGGPPTATRSLRSRGRAVLTAARNYDPLLRNAHLLTVSSLLTSAFGALYWALAAHWYDAATVGRNVAAVSAMMFLGGIGQLNLANAMVRFVPSAGRRAGRLVGLAYAVASSVTLVLAAGFVLLIPWLSPGLDFLHSWGLGLFFAVATAGYAVFNLQDGVLTGLRRADWVALENGLFAVEKIGLLAVLVAFGAENGILVSWMAGLALALVVTNAFVFRRALPRHQRAAPQAAADTSRPTFGYLAADYAGAMCWLAAVNLPPVMVLNRLGAADSAYFSLAWTAPFALYCFSSNMGYSLVVESARDITRLDDYRRVLRHSGRVLVAAVVLLIAVGPWALRVFGADYARHGTVVLWLLALSALPNLLTTTVVALSRARRRMGVVVGVLASLSVTVLALTALLLPVLGIDGAGAAWLIGQTLVAAVLLWRRSWWLPAPPPGGGSAPTGPAAAARGREG